MSDTKRGRRPKLSSETKKKIIDSFYLMKAGANGQRFRAYNIFHQLADYANDAGWTGSNGEKIRPKDFSDETTRKLMESYISLTDQLATQGTPVVPVYEPLDIENLLVRPRKEILSSLRSREDYFAQICKNAGGLQNKCMALQRSLNQMTKEMAELKNTLSEFETINQNLRLKYDKLRNALKKAGIDSVTEWFDQIEDTQFKKSENITNGMKTMEAIQLECAEIIDYESVLLDFANYENQ